MALLPILGRQSGFAISRPWPLGLRRAKVAQSGCQLTTFKETETGYR
jgi:hypothetical protein